MNFCSQCGGKTEPRIPKGEDRERAVCTQCSTVHYLNPKMIVGCIIEHDGQIMLCKRAIEPRYGFWTIPAGFMEMGESAMQGAARESHEEASAHVRIVAPYAHFDVTHIAQAYIVYRAELIVPESGPAFAPGTESLEVKLVRPSEIPWGELAFGAVKQALELYTEDVASGRYRCHIGSIHREDGRFVLKEHIALPVG
jgi:ADP-ribose/FAD diphosphatase